MLNSAPNKSTKYKQGLYIPKNKDKVIKLNSQGGLFYRSGLEHKIMLYLDNRQDIIYWNTELIKIPYIKKVWDNKLQEYIETEHLYYPDFYYEIKNQDNSIDRVVVEVKPHHETNPPKLTHNPTAKQLKNFEYALNEYSKNLDKWKHCINWCDKKGFKFIIITEETFKKFKI